ncbi:TOPRIM nucleotidyl transferase/hydrolase domain-containing protein [Streptomyces sp. NPDC008163]|uniref:TOPRIM nucleotidyl transferase/hydrolase domain-containing protein n=1 Tax=Streptomyces sp. NPDC008163 TaxID=3364818 RepID=UPI0036E5E1F0
MADTRMLQDAVTDWARGGPAEPAHHLADEARVNTAVLLEGPSDVAAVETLAARHGRDLAAEGVCVVSMGGAMNVSRYARILGPPGLGLRLMGLCDEREKGFYERALTPSQAAPTDLYVCSADLEDELVRALGAAQVVDVFRAEGELRAWQSFQRQPAQQGRPRQQQVRRFLGTKKGRKIRYGRLLVEALAPDRTPPPLAGLFANL